MSKVEQGTVKWFDEKKGYGFIACDNGKDIFVHYKAIKMTGYKSLSEGQRVEFMIKNGEKGLLADELIILK